DGGAQPVVLTISPTVSTMMSASDAWAWLATVPAILVTRDFFAGPAGRTAIGAAAAAKRGPCWSAIVQLTARIGSDAGLAILPGEQLSSREVGAPAAAQVRAKN
ncbi:MAG: hypothetical protein EB034_19950, partial [Verrucomicrobia bacterium]|nr:hypothetical protein [Verrucomicrobiota bacterium]